MNICITSEIEKISTVIVHEPGHDHDNMLPENIQEYLGNGEPNPNYLLFDDLIDTQLAVKEHRELTNLIKLFTGPENCIYMNDILDIENEIINKKLSNVIMPNLIFTRDLAITIGKKIITTWAAKKVRNYENRLISHSLNTFINQNLETEIIHFHDIAPHTSLEGGDVTIFNKDLVIIGISERTTKEAINAIETIIFDEGFNRIYAVELPKKRSMMHIDTVLTKISQNEVIYFSPLFDIEKPSIYNISKGQSIKTVNPTQINLIELLNQDGYQTNGIKCGGQIELNQFREQWTDGANAFCLQPGIAIGYSRNIFTIEELRKNGYEIMTSSKFISNFNKNLNKKIFITLNSTEICRGRGGPRCLTLPISRDANG